MVSIESLLAQLEQGDETEKQAADLIRQLSGEMPKNYVLVSKKPTQALLVSMATRFRHDFMGSTREEVLEADKDNPFASFAMSQQEKEYLLSTMTQLHEEVVGEGFYHPNLEQRYVKPKGKTPTV